MALIIDTSVLITLERRDLLLESLRPFMDFDEPLAISSMTISELLIGMLRADSSRRQARRRIFIDGLLARVPILSFDLPSAVIHASIQDQLMAEGQIIGHNDLIIASTALANDFDLLTDNVREFQRVPGLTVRQSVW